MDPHALDDAFLQRVDELCQPGDVVEFVECELGDQPCLFGEPRRDRITVLGIDQRFEVGRADRVELVDTPLHAVDRRSALFDERFSPLDEQLQLARYRIVLDHWQIGFAQHCPGDRGRVYRIGLASGARGGAGTRH